MTIEAYRADRAFFLLLLEVLRGSPHDRATRKLLQRDLANLRIR